MPERGFGEATAAAMRVCRGKICNVPCVEPNESFGNRSRSTSKTISLDTYGTVKEDSPAPRGMICRYFARSNRMRHTNSLLCSWLSEKEETISSIDNALFDVEGSEGKWWLEISDNKNLLSTCWTKASNSA
jgi:hypothetical protein